MGRTLGSPVTAGQEVPLFALGVSEADLRRAPAFRGRALRPQDDTPARDLRLVGFTLGGEVGTKLLWRLGMMASPSTLLRYVRGSPKPVHPLPNVVELVFRNKVELAEVMLGRAFAAGVLARWVVADSFYGRLHSFREWLEERGRPYVVMVPKTSAVPLGGRRKKIEQHVGRLPEDAWSEVRPEVGRRASRCVTGH